MSTRGINFLERWMADHLPNAMTHDPIAVSDLADEMLKAAEREGIKADEINEEVDSVFGVIFEAMHHREGNLPESDQAVLDMLAARLAREDQAGELVKRLGTDWDSLLNEAHFLKELEGR